MHISRNLLFALALTICFCAALLPFLLSATGLDSDLQCVDGDYSCDYDGKTKGPTGQLCMLNKPCEDTTNKTKTTGACAAVKFCTASSKTDPDINDKPAGGGSNKGQTNSTGGTGPGGQPVQDIPAQGSTQSGAPSGVEGQDTPNTGSNHGAGSQSPTGSPGKPNNSSESSLTTGGQNEPKGNQQPSWWERFLSSAQDAAVRMFSQPVSQNQNEKSTQAETGTPRAVPYTGFTQNTSGEREAEKLSPPLIAPETPQTQNMDAVAAARQADIASMNQSLEKLQENYESAKEGLEKAQRAWNKAGVFERGNPFSQVNKDLEAAKELYARTPQPLPEAPSAPQVTDATREALNAARDASRAQELAQQPPVTNARQAEITNLDQGLAYGQQLEKMRLEREALIDMLTTCDSDCSNLQNKIEKLNKDLAVGTPQPAPTPQEAALERWGKLYEANLIAQGKADAFIEAQTKNLEAISKNLETLRAAPDNQTFTIGKETLSKQDAIARLEQAYKDTENAIEDAETFKQKANDLVSEAYKDQGPQPADLANNGGTQQLKPLTQQYADAQAAADEAFYRRMMSQSAADKSLDLQAQILQNGPGITYRKDKADAFSVIDNLNDSWKANQVFAQVMQGQETAALARMESIAQAYERQNDLSYQGDLAMYRAEMAAAQAHNDGVSKSEALALNREVAQEARGLDRLQVYSTQNKLETALEQSGVRQREYLAKAFADYLSNPSISDKQAVAISNIVTSSSQDSRDMAIRAQVMSDLAIRYDARLAASGEREVGTWERFSNSVATYTGRSIEKYQNTLAKIAGADVFTTNPYEYNASKFVLAEKNLAGIAEGLLPQKLQAAIEARERGEVSATPLESIQKAGKFIGDPLVQAGKDMFAFGAKNDIPVLSAGAYVAGGISWLAGVTVEGIASVPASLSYLAGSPATNADIIAAASLPQELSTASQSLRALDAGLNTLIAGQIVAKGVQLAGARVLGTSGAAAVNWAEEVLARRATLSEARAGLNAAEAAGNAEAVAAAQRSVYKAAQAVEEARAYNNLQKIDERLASQTKQYDELVAKGQGGTSAAKDLQNEIQVAQRAKEGLEAKVATFTPEKQTLWDRVTGWFGREEIAPVARSAATEGAAQTEIRLLSAPVREAESVAARGSVAEGAGTRVSVASEASPTRPSASLTETAPTIVPPSSAQLPASVTTSGANEAIRSQIDLLGTHATAVEAEARMLANARPSAPAAQQSAITQMEADARAIAASYRDAQSALKVAESYKSGTVNRAIAEAKLQDAKNSIDAAGPLENRLARLFEEQRTGIQKQEDAAYKKNLEKKPEGAVATENTPCPPLSAAAITAVIPCPTAARLEGEFPEFGWEKRVAENGIEWWYQNGKRLGPVENPNLVPDGYKSVMQYIRESRIGRGVAATMSLVQLFAVPVPGTATTLGNAFAHGVVDIAPVIGDVISSAPSVVVGGPAYGKDTELVTTDVTQKISGIIQPQPRLVAGPDGKIDPVAFTKRAQEKVALSSLNGQAPKELQVFGIKKGTPDEWARFFAMIQQQESGHRIAPVNKDGTLKRFPTTPSGGNSFGPGQFNVGQYGLKTWADVNDPDKVIDAYIKVAEQGKLFQYFGSLQRPKETLQHAGWYATNVQSKLNIQPVSLKERAVTALGQGGESIVPALVPTVFTSPAAFEQKATDLVTKLKADNPTITPVQVAAHLVKNGLDETRVFESYRVAVARSLAKAPTQSEINKAYTPANSAIARQAANLLPADGVSQLQSFTRAPAKEITPASVRDDYLWEAYQRSVRKIDSGGDFTWKDIAGALNARKSLRDYVIGGMSEEIRTNLYVAGKAMDAAGVPWSFLSAYRGLERPAATGKVVASSPAKSEHYNGGYGKGNAADLGGAGWVSAAERDQANKKVWKWLAQNGYKYGLEADFIDDDPAHVISRGNSTILKSQNATLVADAAQQRARVIAAQNITIPQPTVGPLASGESFTRFMQETAQAVERAVVQAVEKVELVVAELEPPLARVRQEEPLGETRTAALDSAPVDVDRAPPLTQTARGSAEIQTVAAPTRRVQDARVPNVEQVSTGENNRSSSAVNDAVAQLEKKMIDADTAVQSAQTAVEKAKSGLARAEKELLDTQELASGIGAAEQKIQSVQSALSAALSLRAQAEKLGATFSALTPARQAIAKVGDVVTAMRTLANDPAMATQKQSLLNTASALKDMQDQMQAKLDAYYASGLKIADRAADRTGNVIQSAKSTVSVLKSTVAQQQKAVTTAKATLVQAEASVTAATQAASKIRTELAEAQKAAEQTRIAQATIPGQKPNLQVNSAGEASPARVDPNKAPAELSGAPKSSAYPTPTEAPDSTIHSEATQPTKGIAKQGAAESEHLPATELSEPSPGSEIAIDVPPSVQTPPREPFVSSIEESNKRMLDMWEGAKRKISSVAQSVREVLVPGNRLPSGGSEVAALPPRAPRVPAGERPQITVGSSAPVPTARPQNTPSPNSEPQPVSSPVSLTAGTSPGAGGPTPEAGGGGAVPPVRRTDVVFSSNVGGYRPFAAMPSGTLALPLLNLCSADDSECKTKYELPTIAFTKIKELQEVRQVRDDGGAKTASNTPDPEEYVERVRRVSEKLDKYEELRKMLCVNDPTCERTKTDAASDPEKLLASEKKIQEHKARLARVVEDLNEYLQRHPEALKSWCTEKDCTPEKVIERLRAGTLPISSVESIVGPCKEDPLCWNKSQTPPTKGIAVSGPVPAPSTPPGGGTGEKAPPGQAVPPVQTKRPSPVPRAPEKDPGASVQPPPNTPPTPPQIPGNTPPSGAVPAIGDGIPNTSAGLGSQNSSGSLSPFLQLLNSILKLFVKPQSPSQNNSSTLSPQSPQPASLIPLSASLFTTDVLVVPGKETKLVWVSAGTRSCVVKKGDNVVASGGSSGSLPLMLATSSPFSLRCESADGRSVSAEMTVEVK
ncbi:hypothetical protein EBR66_05320 [bacterium]|nr:hypothetical protein [bacterium]